MQIESKQSRVKRLILQLIHDMRMKAGDKLPGQSVLRERFGCGGRSYTCAVAELCEEGVLETRDKRGVYLKDANATTQYTRRIGIVAGNLSNNLSLPLKLAYLEEGLNRRGCRPIVFHQSPKSYGTLYNQMNNVVGFEASLKAGELDGVIFTIYMDEATEQYLEKHSIPYLYSCGLRVKNNNADIDYPTMFQRSVEALVNHGMKNIALFYVSRTIHIDWQDQFVKYFKKAMLSQNLECNASNMFPLERASNGYGYGYYVQLRDWCERLSALPESSRPDGLVILDDILTLFLEKHLALHPEWQPTIISLLQQEIFLPIKETKIGHWRFSLRDFMELMLNNFITHIASKEKGPLEWMGFLPKLESKLDN